MFIMKLNDEREEGGETEKERMCYVTMCPVVKSRPVWHLWKLNE